MKKLYLNYRRVLCYPFILSAFFLLNVSFSFRAPVSLALYSSIIYNGFNPFITLILYALSLLYPLNASYLIFATVGGVLPLILDLISTKKRLPVILEPVAAFLSLIPFALFIESESLVINFAFVVLISLSVLPFKTFLNFIGFKRLNAKPDEKDLFSLSYAYFFFALGFLKLIGENAFAPIILTCLLFCSDAFKKSATCIVAIILGLPVALYAKDFTFVATISVFSLVLFFLYDCPKYVTALTVYALDFGVCVLKNVDRAFDLTRLILFACLIIVYMLLPDKFAKNLKSKMYEYEEKSLVKQAVNNVKICLADKLFDLSSSFTKIATALDAEEKEKPCDVRSLCIKLANSVCLNENCKTGCPLSSARFRPLFETGLARGKISLVDVPDDLSVACRKLPAVMYNANKLIADYKAEIDKEREKSLTRKLMAKESQAVGELLKGLAIDVGKTSQINSELEREITNNLLKNGIKSDEIIAFGEGKDLNVHILGNFNDKVKKSNVLKIVTKTLGKRMQIQDVTDVGKNKCALSFAECPKLTATTGVANAPKNGSDLSGDTFTTLNVTPRRKLVAISDGMGSGESANSVSSNALTLFENFYKAGLSSDKVVRSVNKILTVSLKDNFTAMDVSFIDTAEGKLTVMKYGATYSLIFSPSGVKIIEGGSLPIGIVSELEPSSCTTDVKDGDMIIMMSDGVTDNFSGVAELIGFVNDNYTENPQTLSEKLLDRALIKDGGIPHDDMTVVCTKIQAS